MDLPISESRKINQLFHDNMQGLWSIYAKAADVRRQFDLEYARRIFS